MIFKTKAAKEREAREHALQLSLMHSENGWPVEEVLYRAERYARFLLDGEVLEYPPV